MADDGEIARITGALVGRGLSRRDIGRMVERYRDGATVQEIAAELRTEWSVVHVAIFELRRAGLGLPRPRKATGEARRRGPAGL